MRLIFHKIEEAHHRNFVYIYLKLLYWVVLFLLLIEYDEHW